MTSETNEQTHTSALGKIKNLFHHSDHSAHAEGFEDSEIREHVAEGMKIHGAEENRADNIIHDREISEVIEHSDPSNEEVSTSTTLNPEAAHDSNLSSYSPRQSLSAAVNHSTSAGTEHPDTSNYAHIPESQLLHKLHPRSEHTATRPADANDPNSMDGLPESSTAGDDLAI